MVKKRGLVWTYYNKKINGTTVIAFCKFCNRSYIQNATRMEKHLARCEKATPEVKQLFLRVSTSKRVNRARLLGAKIGGNWMKPNGNVTLDISTLTEADLEDIHECMRHEKESAVNNNDDVPVQTLDILGEETNEEQISWANERDIEKNPNRNVNGMKENNKIWMNEEDVQEVKTVNYDDPSMQSRTHAMTIESLKSPTTDLFTLNPRNSNYSPLQAKILQEQLLERRAMRKIAELEMKRKTIEFERYQWEYERDKARADILWAHETRMMQLKEERERKLNQAASTASTTIN